MKSLTSLLFSLIVILVLSVSLGVSPAASLSYASSPISSDLTYTRELGYVSYEGNNQLSTIDTLLHIPLDTIDLAQYGCSEIQRTQLTLDKKFLYIPCTGSDRVLVLDTSDLSLEANIYQAGLTPKDVAFVQDGAYAFVVTYEGGISVINTATYTITQTIPTTGYNHGIVVHPYLPVAYIANGDYAGNGNVLVFDTTNFTILTSIHHGGAVIDVAVSPDGRYAFASEYTASAGIAVIDTQTNSIITVIDGLGDTFHLQISPDGSRLFAAAGWSNIVHVIDALNFTYIASVGTGGRTFDIELNAAGSELFAADHTTTIPVIDTSTYTVIDYVQMPTGEINSVTINPKHVWDGVYLVPSEQLLTGDRGDTLQFVETLSNFTGITDTFTLELGDSLWPVTLSEDTLGPLSHGEQITFTVDVAIPADADLGALNTVLITATSSLSPTVYFDSAVLNSQVGFPPDLFLPMLIKSPAGIGGNVTLNGVPAAGINLELRFYNGYIWSTQASTTTDVYGFYFFTNVPALASGQRYYVRYTNDPDPNRLYTWHTPVNSTYNAASAFMYAPFDIANLTLSTPEPGATVELPVTFTWIPRPATPTDSYEFNLFDPVDDDPYFYTIPPLGYVSGYLLEELPEGFVYGVEYGWGMYIYAPDGGYGLSYYYYSVAFEK